MVRPTGAKATKRRKQKGEKTLRGVSPNAPLFPLRAIKAFALSERTSSYTSTQGAVPVELALGYVLSDPLGRLPHNLTT